MKKPILYVLFILACCVQGYCKIPETYKHFAVIECEIKPVQRGNRNSESPNPLTPLVKLRDDASLNWSGYAAMTTTSAPKSVSNVAGSWVVPKLKSVEGKAFSSIWVGIDGFSSETVEQIGTEHDWIQGKQRNFAWFEMFPKNSFEIVGFPCDPGDHISAEVIFKGKGIFQLVIYNATKFVSYTVPTSFTKSTNAQRSSAEWIVEAPSTKSILPLSNFGTVTLTDCETTIDNIDGTINSSNWINTAITMERGDGTVKAAPSTLSKDGTRFSVTWHHK